MKTATTIATVLFAFFAVTALGRLQGQEPQGVNHKVRRGETLFSIAEKYYGNGYEWIRLKEYNPHISEPDRLEVGDDVYVPDPKQAPVAGGSQTARNIGSGIRSFFNVLPAMRDISFFGKSLAQIGMILIVWFLLHSFLQSLFVWFAAHLTFVKDVSMKKAMRATMQSESLALVCVIMAFLVGLMILYVGTTSPGKPLTTELLGTAEEYLGTPGGIMFAGLLIVALYGFLGIRFIPQAFGLQTGRGVALVMIAILLPHLVGFYLVGHRMGLIQ